MTSSNNEPRLSFGPVASPKFQVQMLSRSSSSVLVVQPFLVVDRGRDPLSPLHQPVLMADGSG